MRGAERRTYLIAVLCGALVVTSCAGSPKGEAYASPAFTDVVRDAQTMSRVDAQTLRGAVNLLALVPFDENGDLRAIVEIPAGTSEKWEISKDDPYTIVLENRHGAPRIVAYLAYPANYGAIPGTIAPKDLGGDGDPLDVLVLGPALPRGEIVRIRLIGVLRMIEDGEQDDKLIAVLTDRSPFSNVRTIAELDRDFPGAADMIEIWFGRYKGEASEVELLGFEEAESACGRRGDELAATDISGCRSFQTNVRASSHLAVFV